MELALHNACVKKTPITWSDVVAMSKQMKNRGLVVSYTVKLFLFL